MKSYLMVKFLMETFAVIRRNEMKWNEKYMHDYIHFMCYSMCCRCHCRCCCTFFLFLLPFHSLISFSCEQREMCYRFRHIAMNVHDLLLTIRVYLAITSRVLCHFCHQIFIDEYTFTTRSFVQYTFYSVTHRVSSAKIHRHRIVYIISSNYITRN